MLLNTCHLRRHLTPLQCQHVNEGHDIIPFLTEQIVITDLMPFVTNCWAYIGT